MLIPEGVATVSNVARRILHDPWVGPAKHRVTPERGLGTALGLQNYHAHLIAGNGSRGAARKDIGGTPASRPGGSFAQVNHCLRCLSCQIGPWWARAGPSSEAERTADLLPYYVVLTGDALGVDPQ